MKKLPPIPDKGDIVSLNFDPSTGKEIMKRRPAFVISRRIFNDHTGFAVVAPIVSATLVSVLEDNNGKVLNIGRRSRTIPPHIMLLS